MYICGFGCYRTLYVDMGRSRRQRRRYESCPSFIYMTSSRPPPRPAKYLDESSMLLMTVLVRFVLVPPA